MASGLDVHDQAQLAGSLAAWKAELARDRKTLSAAQKGVAEAQRHVQQTKALVERREAQIARIAPAGPRRKAVKLALSYVGTKENPPNSNRGAVIDGWQRQFHMFGQPWCGAFVGAIAEQAGANVTDRIVYTPYIYEDAKLRRNGLDGVVWKASFSTGNTAAHSGDLVLFHFGSGGIKHVGMLVAPWKGGALQTVEGNTSFGGAGSQDNGGAVARRARDISLVHSIVSVRWP